MRPFWWAGQITRDTYKAMVLQLDPGDDEAEQHIRYVLERRVARALEDAMGDILADITRRRPDTVEGAIQNVHDQFGTEEELYRALRHALTQSADLGVSAAVTQMESIGLGFDWTLANTAARDWAAQYSGTLIRDIERTTVEAVRQRVASWIDSRETLQQLADDLAPVFGRRRADMIAATEVTRAVAEGNRIAYRESGVVEQIEIRTSRDERVCPVCGPLHGTQHPLATGHPTLGFPPYHVACRCWIVPVVPEPGE